jgi:serine/threonine protein kinase
MQSFFRTLKGYATGAADFAQLRAELERLVAQAPESIGGADNALEAYFRSDVLTAGQFEELKEILKPHMNEAADETLADMTRMRKAGAPEEAHPAASSHQQAQATYFRNKPEDAPEPQGTLMRASQRRTTDPARTASPSSPSALDTDRRWEDPHTWTMADDQPLFEGRILGRHYQLERQIGEGGMGVVWLAKDLIEADFSEKPYLAIKVLKPDFRAHPDALKALHEEVRRSKLLSHPNIVSVYTFDRDAGVVFMTMEYLEGKPLSHVIEQDFARGMPFAQAWPILEGAGRALAYAHDRGTIHSDFKPSNVFVTAGGRAKVLDFGIARAMRRGRGFDAGTLGALTVEYASCEMLEEQPPDLRDDVYAYGCVVYELLSGQHVFGGKSATDARDGKIKVVPLKILTRAQNKALADALAFDRDKRTSSIEGVIECLRPRGQAQRYGLWAAGLLLGILAVGGAVWWGSNKLHGRSEDEVFINSLLKPNAESNTAVDPDTIALLMAQGDDYLAQAQKHFDAAVLSEGVSTAYGAFRAVLRLDPANRPAAEKILEIVKLYESEAENLRTAGQFKRAATLTGYALKIDPDRPSLRQMKSELDLMASAGSDTAQQP